MKGTTRGTITNANGQFELMVSSLPITLEVRFIGYATAEYQIDAVPQKPLEFLLQRVSFSLDELVVTGENPAYNIMRQVLLAKERMRAHLGSTYADTYTRFMLYA